MIEPNWEFRKLTADDYEILKKKLGLFLKIERIKHDTSILQLSEISGVTQTQISKLENGKVKAPSLKTYLQICYALNIDLFDFISEISESSPFNKTEQELN